MFGSRELGATPKVPTSSNPFPHCLLLPNKPYHIPRFRVSRYLISAMPGDRGPTGPFTTSSRGRSARTIPYVANPTDQRVHATGIENDRSLRNFYGDELNASFSWGGSPTSSLHATDKVARLVGPVNDAAPDFCLLTRLTAVGK